MFDVDGTLVKSFEFDEECYIDAIFEVLGHRLDTNWQEYEHITDSGILSEHLKRKGITDQHKEIHQAVKTSFVAKIKAYLSSNRVEEIEGASSIIDLLRNNPEIGISIATGGWLETALLKLQSAGIDVSGVPIASSNDHYSRIEIMKLANDRSMIGSEEPVIYFGDAQWDRAACNTLGYKFVLIGDRIEHEFSIDDFRNINQVMSVIGL